MPNDWLQRKTVALVTTRISQHLPHAWSSILWNSARQFWTRFPINNASMTNANYKKTRTPVTCHVTHSDKRAPCTRSSHLFWASASLYNRHSIHLTEHFLPRRDSHQNNTESVLYSIPVSQESTMEEPSTGVAHLSQHDPLSASVDITTGAPCIFKCAPLPTPEFSSPSLHLNHHIFT